MTFFTILPFRSSNKSPHINLVLTAYYFTPLLCNIRTISLHIIEIQMMTIYSISATSFLQLPRVAQSSFIYLLKPTCLYFHAAGVIEPALILYHDKKTYN